MSLFSHEAFNCRFAPSPTGRMHAGNIFAALVSWLMAQATRGKVVLRIEDLDQGRSRTEYASRVCSDFEQLGLSWDEGPYYQAHRFSLYQEAFNCIARQASVYPCFCSRSDLHAASAPHAGERFIYAGTCRNLSVSEQSERSLDRAPSWRVEVPSQDIVVNDFFQGSFQENLFNDCGDFVLKRADESFAYQLAVVVDDADQKITCVVRGCDLLSSTPQQMWLQRLLGVNTPHYAHVPLFMGHDGTRLSKRHASASLEELLVQHKTPEGVIGAIAFAAGLINEYAPVTPEELLRVVTLDQLQKTFWRRKEIAWTTV